MHVRRVILFLVYCLTVILPAARGYSFENRLQNPSSFKTMLRYGRSSRTNNNNRDGKPVVVYPRADSFFLTTRYGKRSAWSPNDSLAYPVSVPLCGEDDDLSCTWVGLSNIYRCTARKDLLTSN